MYSDETTRYMAEFLVNNAYNIENLERVGLNPLDLINYYINQNTREKAEFFLNKSFGIKNLKEVGIDLQYLFNWYNDPHTHDKAKFLIEHADTVNQLHKERFFNISDLIELYDNLPTRNIAELLVDGNIVTVNKNPPVVLMKIPPPNSKKF